MESLKVETEQSETLVITGRRKRSTTDEDKNNILEEII